jgi:hypothetical protein
VPKLQPVATATTVRGTDGGESLVSDGPFVEAKKFLGGYYLVEAENLEQGTSWQVGSRPHGWAAVEVRPLADH